MSEKAANSWLENHDDQIPAFDQYHRQVIEALHEGVASLAEIADIIMLDPGLSIALLRKVNANLLHSRRPGIDTVHTAIGYLGKPAVTTLVNKTQPLAERCGETSTINLFRQLLSQNHHALAQLDGFLKIQGIGSVDDIRAAMLLHNLAEILVCLFDPEKYRDYRHRLRFKPDKTDHATDVFGFEFDKLGIHLSQHWHLPELVSESLKITKNISRKARLIQLAGAVAQQAESGWYHQTMQKVEKDCAKFLDLSERETRQHIYSVALRVARESKMDDVFPAASRLILLPDIEKPTPVKNPQAQSLGDKLKILLKSPNCNQLQIISELLTSLYEQADFSRVVLMMLSNDQAVLAARAGKGLGNESPFRKLQLEVARSGLFKSLIQKPQAIHVNATSYRKYENSLPGKFKATCLCNNFVMMSIFVGNRPFGLVYCDRSISGESIDKAGYNRFKADIMITSKALTFLAKRQAQAAA